MRDTKADMERLAATMFDDLSYGTRVVVGVRIDETNRCFAPLFGDWSLFKSDAPFVPALAGYHVASSYADGADVFLASDRLLAAATREYETILLHELAHLAVGVGVGCARGILDHQRTFAAEVFGAMHPETRQQHPIAFCEKLTEAATRYAISVGASTKEVVRSALREELVMWEEVLAEL